MTKKREVEDGMVAEAANAKRQKVLDFDFEKFCSVSLTNLNVYGCLVCGNLEAGHHVFINLRTEKVYCLPDGYEVIDPSLDDIIHVLNPRFTQEQVEQLDKSRQWCRALDGSDYLPGTVGLNNIKETDFVNVTIQSLMRVTPLRNYFLIPENYQHNRSPLVSPPDILQAVMKASKKLFRIGAQSDPGELEVVKEMLTPIAEKRENAEDDERESHSIGMETSRMPFLMLGHDLPPPPLFTDVMEKNIIPQVPLFNILKKFDGETVTEVVRPHIARMRYRVTKLPEYLILHMRRFTKNNFFMEKNPTLGEGSYKVFVQRKSEELWYEMQGLHVSETLPQMVALSETYMQIYEQYQQ
ncbi:unnamed protein product [Withania somnifera]